MVFTETVASQPGSRSAGVLTKASAYSAPASLTSLRAKHPEFPPISIEPSMGAVKPKEMQNFNVRFSPLQVAQFQGRLLCRYSNKELCCERDKHNSCHFCVDMYKKNLRI